MDSHFNLGGDNTEGTYIRGAKSTHLAQFDAGSLLHKVNFTRGVCNVVGFGNGPSPVDDILIDTIKSEISPAGS